MAFARGDARDRRALKREIAVTSALFALALGVRLLNLNIIKENPYFSAPIMDEEYHHRWETCTKQSPAGSGP